MVVFLGAVGQKGPAGRALEQIGAVDQAVGVAEVFELRVKLVGLQAGILHIAPVDAEPFAPGQRKEGALEVGEVRVHLGVEDVQLMAVSLPQLVLVILQNHLGQEQDQEVDRDDQHQNQDVQFHREASEYPMDFHGPSPPGYSFAARYTPIAHVYEQIVLHFVCICQGGLRKSRPGVRSGR